MWWWCCNLNHLGELHLIQKEARKYDVQIIWVKPGEGNPVQSSGWSVPAMWGTRRPGWMDSVSWGEREEEEVIARSCGVLQAILRSWALTVSNVLARSVWLLF